MFKNEELKTSQQAEIDKLYNELNNMEINSKPK
jgi:hypothetical protein